MPQGRDGSVCFDNALIELLYKPTNREDAPEAFKGFVNLFDDHLAPELMQKLAVPVDVI